MDVHYLPFEPILVLMLIWLDPVPTIRIDRSETTLAATGLRRETAQIGTAGNKPRWQTRRALLRETGEIMPLA